jgi:hypothetical protein
MPQLDEAAIGLLYPAIRRASSFCDRSSTSPNAMAEGSYLFLAVEIRSGAAMTRCRSVG